MRKTNNENEYRAAKVRMSSIYGYNADQCFDMSSCYPEQLIADIESGKIAYIDTDGGVHYE